MLRGPAPFAATKVMAHREIKLKNPSRRLMAPLLLWTAAPHSSTSPDPLSTPLGTLSAANEHPKYDAPVSTTRHEAETPLLPVNDRSARLHQWLHQQPGGHSCERLHR